MTNFGSAEDGSGSRRRSKFQIDDRGAMGFDNDDERKEKPWQQVPSTGLLLVLGVYLLLAYLTQLIEDDMPSIVKENSLAKDNSDTFSEESALRYLHQILGDGPRVAGTKYHLEKTHDMKKLVDDIAAEANLKVTTDWQMVSGDYFLKSSAPFVNLYQNCSNIIALLEGESGFNSNGELGTSILVNCHYDSVPFAMGASDNGVFCAAMAETLAKLSKRKTKLKHNIIFLFNGAEENPMQASHGFLSHVWARGAVALINLDSSGINGKPMVFQVTEPRVMDAYSRTAQRPSAQGLAEFLFTSGVVRSDTDFRVFRDFGDIHGIDIAFIKQGHVYHTRNDRVELIRPGVIQNAGNMLLALVSDVANLNALRDKITPSAAMYVDYLNIVMVTYSYTIAYIVDAIVILAGLTSVYYYLWLVGPRLSSVKELLFSMLGRLLSVVLGAVVGAMFIAIMVNTTTQMRYLSRAWLVIPLYWLPYLIVAISVSHLYDKWRFAKSGLPRSLRVVQAHSSTRLILCVSLLLLLLVPRVAALRYLVAVVLVIMSLTSLVSVSVVRFFRLTGWQHLILEVLLSIPCVIWTMSLSLRLDATMLPLMGRSALTAPDYTVGLLNIGLAVLVATAGSGIELLFSRKRLWMVLSSVGVVCVVLMFIPFSPYDENGIALQRHYWFHSQITSHDINGVPVSQFSGILITKMDPYAISDVTSALESNGIDLKVRDFSADCDKKIYCGMPTYRSSFGSQSSSAMFLQSNGPAPFSPPPSLVVHSKICSSNICTYHFIVTGGGHNIITLWPHSNITISSWSLSSPVSESFSQGGRGVYVIHQSVATYMGEWDFQFQVSFNVPVHLQSGPIVDVSYHSNKLQHPEDFTTLYKSIVNVMPEYFNIATVLSFRNDYIF